MLGTAVDCISVPLGADWVRNPTQMATVGFVFFFAAVAAFFFRSFLFFSGQGFRLVVERRERSEHLPGVASESSDPVIEVSMTSLSSGRPIFPATAFN